jgi:putative ABC transport system substrate-binding protein
MRRREFIAGLGAAICPLAARAQGGPMRRIGVLNGFGQNDPAAKAHIGAFRQELEKLGWSEGRNVKFEMRWAEDDPRKFQEQATELVGLPADVILTVSQRAFSALRQATRSIPVVFVQVTDPLGAGLIASLARPAGNMTGFANYETVAGKLLEMLKEVSPGIAEVGVILHPENASNNANMDALEAAARSFAVRLSTIAIRERADIEPRIEEFAVKPNVGLVVLSNATTTLYREWIAMLAIRHRIPSVYPYRYFTADGGLLSYGADLMEVYRQAAGYVDRILRGARPEDLPVQRPVKLELVINLKTAKAIGISIPGPFFARVDEVIE